VRALAQGYVADLGPVLEEIFEMAGIPRDTRIEDLPVPFIATATDVLTGACLDIARGPLLPALLASSAQPPVFRTPRIDGRTLYDGAVSGYLNLGAAHGKGMEVIGVDLSTQCGSPPANAYDDLSQALELLLRRQADQEYRLHAGCCGVACLRPGLPRVEPERSGQIDTIYELGSAHGDLVAGTRPHGFVPGIYAPTDRGAKTTLPASQPDAHALPMASGPRSIGLI
jgi:predicted acylesterase/phospholipase RssA